MRLFLLGSFSVRSGFVLLVRTLRFRRIRSVLVGKIRVLSPHCFCCGACVNSRIAFLGLACIVGGFPLLRKDSIDYG